MISAANPEILSEGLNPPEWLAWNEGRLAEWNGANEGRRLFVLPWPPSVNHVWRTGQGRTYVDPRLKKFRQEAIWAIREQLGLKVYQTLTPAKGEAWAGLHVLPPDRRRRDLDNIFKASLDILVMAGLILDDSQISRLWALRHAAAKAGGKVGVELIRPGLSEQK